MSIFSVALFNIFFRKKVAKLYDILQGKNTCIAGEEGKMPACKGKPPGVVWVCHKNGQRVVSGLFCWCCAAAGHSIIAIAIVLYCVSCPVL